MEDVNANDAEPILVDCPHCYGKHYKGLRCPLAPTIKGSCPDHGIESVRSPMLDTADFHAFYCPHDHHFYLPKPRI